MIYTYTHRIDVFLVNDGADNYINKRVQIMEIKSMYPGRK